MGIDKTGEGAEKHHKCLSSALRRSLTRKDGKSRMCLAHQKEY